MGCCEKFGKYLLICINIIFTIFGWAITCLGLWILLTSDDSQRSTIYILHTISFIPETLLVLGILMSVISCLGFWGALREKPWLLKAYGWILLFILMFKMWAAIFICVSSYRERMDVSEISEFEKMFEQYGLRKGDTLLVNAVQQKFECCGYDDPWTMKFQNGTYPWSCCGNEENIICKKPTYTTSCVFRITEVMSPVIFTASIIYYTILGIQVLCIIIACRLSSSISRKLAAKSMYLHLT